MITGLGHAGPGIACHDQLSEEKHCQKERIFPAGADQKDKDQVCRDGEYDIADINIVMRLAACCEREQKIRNIGENIVGAVGNIT